MFCYRCGGSMPDTATACPQCGAAVQTPQSTAPPPAAGTPAPYQPAVPQGQSPQHYGQPQQESSGQATASLVFGILSVTCFGILAGIPAVILGHIAKSNIRKSNGRLTGDGKATAGLIMGYISIAMIPIVMAIAIPSLLRARIEANHSAGIATLRTINAAQTTYTMAYPSAGYARDLATLGPGPSGTCAGQGTQEYACLIDGKVANSTCTAGSWCVKSGYEYSMTRPLTEGSTGTKSFCSTADGAIRSRIRAHLTSPPTVEECQSWNPIY
jgi:type IV pilus assembly protein PilA